MIKKLLLYTTVGMGIGFLITNVMFWFSAAGSGNLAEESALLAMDKMIMQYTVWMIASALYGAASLILESERLRPSIRSIVHFLVCLTITLCAWSAVKVLLSGTFHLTSLFLLLVEFVIIYLAIFFTMYRYARADAKEINEKLKSK